MTAFIGKRLAQAVPVLLGVAVLVFVLIKLVPGDPVSILAGPDPEHLARGVSGCSLCRGRAHADSLLSGRRGAAEADGRRHDAGIRKVLAVLIPVRQLHDPVGDDELRGQQEGVVDRRLRRAVP